MKNLFEQALIMRDQEWDIKGRAEACGNCEKPFEDGQQFYSQLSHGEEGYTRADVCEACWENAQKEGALSTWRGVFKSPPPPPEEALKKETAESLLRRFVETENPANRNTIYILAVMLERRRVLIEKDVQEREDGMKVRIYEHRHTGDVFVIPDPQLKLAELEHVQEEVVVMLGGKPRQAACPASRGEGSLSAEALAKAEGQKSDVSKEGDEEDDTSEDDEDEFDDDDD